MAARKSSTTTKTAPVPAEAPAPRRRATRKAAEPVIEVRLSPEEVEARLREEIAVQAYLLWQSGAPGSQSDHWLTAEQSLRSA